MAGDLFGAPRGFIAAEDQANRTGLAQVQAQKLLGDIAGQPSEVALRQAQARHLDAESGKLDAANADLQAMAGWEAAARAAGQVIPATQGREATVGDVPQFKPGSVADPLRKLYDTMVAGGAPTRMTLPLAEKIAGITEKEAITSYRDGQAAVQQLEVKKRLAEQVGSIAKAAYDTPQGYAQMRLLYTQLGQGLPPQIKKIIDGLPQDWQAGRRALEPIITSSMSAKDAAELALNERKQKTDDALAATTMDKNRASASLAQVRKGLVSEQTTILKKLGGEGTPAAEAASEVRTAATLQAMEAKQLAMHPALPATADKVKPGKTYTLADKSVGRAVTQADGTIGLEIIQPPLKTRMQPRTPEEIRAARVKALKASGVSVGVDDEED